MRRRKHRLDQLVAELAARRARVRRPPWDVVDKKFIRWTERAVAQARRAVEGAA